eukprot:g32358.t1
MKYYYVFNLLPLIHGDFRLLLDSGTRTQPSSSNDIPFCGARQRMIEYFSWICAWQDMQAQHLRCPKRELCPRLPVCYHSLISHNVPTASESSSKSVTASAGYENVPVGVNDRDNVSQTKRTFSLCISRYPIGIVLLIS